MGEGQDGGVPFSHPTSVLLQGLETIVPLLSVRKWLSKLFCSSRSCFPLISSPMFPGDPPVIQTVRIAQVSVQSVRLFRVSTARTGSFRELSSEDYFVDFPPFLIFPITLRACWHLSCFGFLTSSLPLEDVTTPFWEKAAMKPSCPDSFCLSLACSLLVLFGFASKSRAALPLLELGPILAQTVIGQSASSEVLLYIHTDHLGTPVMMTDEQ